MIKRIALILSAITLFAQTMSIEACTSAIVAGKASASGRPMLWKHRDTGCESNFVERVPASGDTHGYVALFNAGDSLLKEAWMGMNDAGFAIMNTASYNLAPDTTVYKDREGEVMTAALRQCSSVNDFEHLLLTLPKPLGVQANFGVIDAAGNGAYFETDDYNFTKFDLADAPDGVIIRTNFSFSGNETDGYGYIRYDNASHLLADKIKSGELTPADFTEGVSRSYYHSLLGYDVLADTARWVVDQDFIPRNISTASVVIELDGKNDGVMWTALGYPPCAIVEAATVDYVPDNMRPLLPGYKSAAAEESLSKKRKAFPIKRGSGPRYLDMDFVRKASKDCHEKSMINYAR
ncbi:MAG: hypothetical protein K2J12_03530 [Muribaculaceae bacterium]|nr:hypothetical protein [Muribaculaceae bacterium]